MKKSSTLLRIGAILVAAGFVLFMAALILTGVDFSTVSMTDAEKLSAAQTAEKAAGQYRVYIVARIDDMISYYTGRQGAAGVTDSAPYAERAGLFSDLKENIISGAAISADTYNKLMRMQSLDGEENEVVPLNNLQNNLRNIYTNENLSAQYRSEVTGTVSEAEVSAAEKAAAQPKSKTIFYVLMACGVLMFACGLYLNHNYQMKKVLGQAVLYTLLAVGAVIMVFPFYWMITSSFKTRVEASRFPPEFWPSNILNIDNYRMAFKQAPFAQYFVNSIIVCVCSVAVVTITTILASFAFSRLKFPGRELIFSALLSMMMLPFEMLVITNYTTIIRLNMNDTLAALIVPFISSIFYTYIMRNFFASIPDSLYWSARVDGCSNWRYLWRVMVPIARPSLVTVVLLNALASWNSFMWPLLVIKTKVNRTLPFGLYAFTTEAGAYQELIMAASTVVVIPMIILFLFARKQILRGVARGGIKG